MQDILGCIHYIYTLYIILGWPKSSFGFSCKMLWENPNNF